jgi:outer membrane protein OmpA-like peptidoglycan-associated protein
MIRRAPAVLALVLLVGGCAAAPFVRTGFYPLDSRLPPLPGDADAPAPGSRSFVILLPNEDATVGEIEVKTERGTRVLREAGEMLDFAAQDEVLTMAEADLEGSYQARLEVLPPAAEVFVLYFEIDSVDLTAESRERSTEIASALAGRKAPDIRIVGHADSAGSEEHNLELSSRRATSVSELLLAGGVEPASLILEPRGESELAVPTADGVRQPRNRRVELTVW